MTAADYAAPRPLEAGKIETISDALTFLERLKARPDEFFVYRGHADFRWLLVPSLFRQDQSIIDRESDAIRELIALYPADFSADSSMFDRLVRMQHFGLPTRLLDVTRNPLAALYFAVEDKDENNGDDGSLIALRVPNERRKYFDSDSVSCSSNLANLSNDEKSSIEDSKASSIADLKKIHAVDRLYQFVRVEKPHFRPRIRKEDLFKPYYVVPKMSNRRIIAQNGAFVTFGLNLKKGPSYKRGMSSLCARIPAAAKPALREGLERLGYDDGSLFPEIERAARQIVRRLAS